MTFTFSMYPPYGPPRTEFILEIRFLPPCFDEDTVKSLLTSVLGFAPESVDRRVNPPSSRPIFYVVLRSSRDGKSLVKRIKDTFTAIHHAHVFVLRSEASIIRRRTNVRYS